MKNKKQSGKRFASAKSVPLAARPRKKKALSRKGRILLFILIGALSLGALVGGFFGIRALLGYGRDFNYMEANLAKYVRLSAEDLKNISLTVRVDKPTDEDLEREITALLVEHKTIAPGAPDPDAVIQNGSVVSFYYSGYLLGADGGKEYFSGGSNLSSAAKDTPYELAIGSAGFIPGFESGLCGVRPSDTQIPTVITEGTLSEGDTVYVNITGFHPNGKGMNLYGQRLVLTPALDEEYGAGFYELLLGASLDKNLCPTTTTMENVQEGAGTFVYTNVRPMYKTEGGRAHTVECYFPMDYGEASLDGKTAYFDVYIKDSTTYVLPELTDAFLTDTVGVLPAKLADYEGDSLVEKYKSYVRATLEEDYQARLLEASEESFWEKIAAIAQIKRVPRAAMLEVYDEYMADLESTYQSYLTNMGITKAQYPFKTFTKEYFQLEDGESYKDRVKENATQTAGEKMIFFYAIELLQVAPSESELSSGYEEILTDLAKEYCLLDESYYEGKTDPEEKKAAYDEYISELGATKDALLETLGEEYLLESAYYNHGFPKLLALTKIKYVGRGHS